MFSWTRHCHPIILFIYLFVFVVCLLSHVVSVVDCFSSLVRHIADLEGNRTISYIFVILDTVIYIF